MITTLGLSHNSLEDSCLLYFQVWLLPSHGEFSSITLRANLRTACVSALPRMHWGVLPPSPDSSFLSPSNHSLEVSSSKSQFWSPEQAPWPAPRRPSRALGTLNGTAFCCWSPRRSCSAGQQSPFLSHLSFPGPHRVFPMADLH